MNKKKETIRGTGIATQDVVKNKEGAGRLIARAREKQQPFLFSSFLYLSVRLISSLHLF